LSIRHCPVVTLVPENEKLPAPERAASPPAADEHHSFPLVLFLYCCRDIPIFLGMHPNSVARRFKHDSINPLLPVHGNLEDLKKASKNCQACDLWKRGTQTIFGEGMPHAKIMFVGEHPGDQEDLQGRPFLGPAGKLLDRALLDAG
jgi:hypothetical protein